MRRSPSQASFRQGAHFFFDAEFDWIGLGVKVGYKGLHFSPVTDTILSLSLMGVYDTYGYSRTPGDLPYEGALPGNGSVIAPYASRLTIRSALELAQGLIWNERDQCDTAEFFLACKLR